MNQSTLFSSCGSHGDETHTEFFVFHHVDELVVPECFRGFIMMVILLFLVMPMIVSASDSSSNSCQRVCGETRVSYPFGFSDGCEIRLNCSDRVGSSRIMIFDFLVHNVTNDNILVSFPPQCSRSIRDLEGLFGQNFAPTWRNLLLFENCSERLHDCPLPSRLLSSALRNDCVVDYHNVSCYLGAENSNPFLDYRSVVSTTENCSVLVSSITSSLGWNGTSGESIALGLNVLELGWWVPGSCDCDPNTNCTPVLYGSSSGYRCNCKNGFTGDGFNAGNGCRRVRDCVAGGHKCGRIKVVTLASGIIAGASLMAALILIFYHLKKRSATLKSRVSAKRFINEASGNLSVPFYPYRDIQRATNGFSENQKLGTGAYGTVYAGKLHNDECVAIKRIRCRDDNSSEQVMNEIKLLTLVSHPNLVQLLGWCIENGEQILVYEFMPNGTLAQHLQRERGISALPWTIRLNIAAETASAIAYLHTEMNPPVYHRDIKSSNILLDYNFNSKVADFGLSRFGMIDDSCISTTPQGTPGYVDPQYHQNFHLSDKSDVYSFGVVLVEIITSMKAVDLSRPNCDVTLAAMAVERIGKGRIEEIIDPYLEPNRDAWTLSSVHQVAELAFRCLAFHREMRPSMMEVAEELEHIRNRAWEPIEATLEMGSSRSSRCSSTLARSEQSFGKSASIKTVASTRQRVALAATSILSVVDSPVSLQDSCPSLHSSTSTNSLLCNVVN